MVTQKETQQKISLKEIAARAGVSAMTVSRILKGKGKGMRRTAVKRAERVRKIAQEMGYRRHAAPNAMRTGRYNAVGILRSSELGRIHLPSNRLFGVQEALTKKNMHLMVSPLSDEKLTDNDYVPEILSEWMVDGLLIDYIVSYPQRMIELIAHYKVPAIWMNSKHKYDCVYPDDIAAARTATEHLLEMGHRRIAMWLSSTNPSWPVHYSRGDRIAGYEQGMKSASLAPEIITKNSSMTCVEQRVSFKKLLESPDRPTAVITYGPSTALIASVVAHSLGLRVPEDFCVFTFVNDLTIVRPAGIISMILPERAVGEKAVEMVLKKIDMPRKRLKAVSLPMEMDMEVSHKAYSGR